MKIPSSETEDKQIQKRLDNFEIFISGSLMQ